MTLPMPRIAVHYCAMHRDDSLIDHKPRRGDKVNFAPHEAQRYKARSSVEPVNAHLKDYHGGHQV